MRPGQAGVRAAGAGGAAGAVTEPPPPQQPPAAHQLSESLHGWQRPSITPMPVVHWVHTPVSCSHCMQFFSGLQDGDASGSRARAAW